MDRKKCAVCYTTISFPYEYNKAETDENDFHITCVEHKKYAKTFLIETISENLGYKDFVDKECVICKTKLCNSEINKCLEVNSFHYLCEKHLNKHSKSFLIK